MSDSEGSYDDYYMSDDGVSGSDGFGDVDDDGYGNAMTAFVIYSICRFNGYKCTVILLMIQQALGPRIISRANVYVFLTIVVHVKDNRGNVTIIPVHQLVASSQARILVSGAFE